MPDRSTPPPGFDRELGADGRERRGYGPVPSAETRHDDDGGHGIRGYGAVFGVLATIGGRLYGWDEELDAEAFASALTDDADVLSMRNHNPDLIIGATADGSLRLSTDTTGLIYDVDVDSRDAAAMSTWAQVDSGKIKGSSIWFRVQRQEWTYPTEQNDLERPHRRILEADLYEVGPVAFPAFPTTTAGSRAAGSAEPGLDLVLREAMDAGMSLDDIVARARSINPDTSTPADHDLFARRARLGRLKFPSPTPTA